MTAQGWSINFNLLTGQVIVHFVTEEAGGNCCCSSPVFIWSVKADDCSQIQWEAGLSIETLPADETEMLVIGSA